MSRELELDNISDAGVEWETDQPPEYDVYEEQDDSGWQYEDDNHPAVDVRWEPES